VTAQIYKTFPKILSLLLGLLIITSLVRVEAQQSDPHTVRTTKFTIKDVDTSTAFYEDLVGMTELDRFEAGDSLVEPFMAFQDDGKRIGLLRFTEYENIKKSSHPVSVLVVPSLDAIIKRFNDANYPITQHLGVTSAGYGASEAGGVNTAIIHDPSGNGIELIETGGRATVVGARLIVNDRKEAEDFFVRIFDVTEANVSRLTPTMKSLWISVTECSSRFLNPKMKIHSPKASTLSSRFIQRLPTKCWNV